MVVPPLHYLLAMWPVASLTPQAPDAQLAKPASLFPQFANSIIIQMRKPDKGQQAGFIT